VKRRLFVQLAVGLAALTVIGAAAGAGSSADRHAKRALTSITYSTSFGTLGRDCYAYVALEKGFFRDEGFAVKIVPGAGSVPIAQGIAAGTLDYGVADVGAVAVAKGSAAIPVKFVALIQQKTMSSFLALKGSGITKPADLAGKKVAAAPGGTEITLLPLYAKRAGFDVKSVTFVPAAPPALPQLLASKQVDAVGQFTVGVPAFNVTVGGEGVVSLPYAKLVPGLVGIGLFTSEKRIAQSPGEVKRFARALLKGEKWALDNPGQAGAVLNKHVPLQNPVLAAKELRIMKTYAMTPDVRKLGMGLVDRKNVASTISIINNFFKPKERMTVSDMYAPGFAPSKGK